jgi:hypothetical protein
MQTVRAAPRAARGIGAGAGSHTATPRSALASRPRSERNALGADSAMVH